MTDRFAPVPDNPAGASLPYRGAVDHGVPFTEPELADEAHYHSGRPVEYMDEETEPVPVPVRVVNQSARELRLFRTLQVQPGMLLQMERAVQIASRDEKRTKITLMAESTNAEWIYIGGPDLNWDTPSASAKNGYPLIPGKELVLNTTEPVYAVTVSGADDMLHVVIEYTQAVT